MQEVVMQVDDLEVGEQGDHHLWELTQPAVTQIQNHYSLRVLEEVELLDIVHTHDELGSTDREYTMLRILQETTFLLYPEKPVLLFAKITITFLVGLLGYNKLRYTVAIHSILIHIKI
jgi:hypothetical protein